MLDSFSLPNSVTASDVSEPSSPVVSTPLTGTQPGLSDDHTDPEHLKEMAEAIGYVAIPADVYHETLRAAHQPTADEVEKKAIGLGMVSFLPDHAPTQEELQDQASKIGMVVINEKNHKEALRLAYQPTVDEIKKKASGLGLDIVPKDDKTRCNSHLKKLSNKTHKN